MKKLLETLTQSLQRGSKTWYILGDWSVLALSMPMQSKGHGFECTALVDQTKDVDCFRTIFPWGRRFKILKVSRQAFAAWMLKWGICAGQPDPPAYEAGITPSGRNSRAYPVCPR